jgi:hypothetical protein
MRNGGGKPQKMSDVGLYIDEGFWKTLRQDEADRVLGSLNEEQVAVLNSGMTIHLDKPYSIRKRRSVEPVPAIHRADTEALY